MAQLLSRRVLADHIASRLLAEDDAVITQLASYLIETGQVKATDLYVRDIEAALLDKGVIIADVISARDLTDATKNAITNYLGKSYSADTIELRPKTDADLIAGIKVQTADAEYDATVRRQLTKLQKMKV